MTVVRILIFTLATFIFFIGVSTSQHGSSSYLVHFYLQDAIEDPRVPDSLQSYFADFDDLPLTSVPLDLNGDEVKEKFIPNKFLRGSGGCPWIVYNPHSGKVIGEIDLAKVIFVQRKKVQGYSILECYISDGAEEGLVALYEMNKGEYRQTGAYSLHGDQIDRYFEERRGVPPIQQKRQ